ncbi:MAG: hypothetical protein NTX24_00350 [Candidatus Pacearchaeota archaeon]|nr:hypothetical protein [Candidatus Pacearchaeota archaeon]
MEKLSSIVKFLDRELKTKKIKDISVNGLQVKAKKTRVYRLLKKPRKKKSIF